MLMDEGVLLTGRTHSGGVDKRHQFGGISVHETEEEAAIGVIDVHQILILVKIRSNALETSHVETLLKSRSTVHQGGQQTIQFVLAALRLSEIEAL